MTDKSIAYLCASRATASARAALRTIADRAPMLAWMTDADHRLSYLAPALARQVSKDELLDLGAWMEIVHPDDRERVIAALSNAIGAMEAYELEYRIVNSDGAARWKLSCGAPRIGDDGGLLGYSGTIVDVSARREQLQRALENEASCRLLMENSTDVISHHGPDGTLLYVSPSLVQVLGFSPEELVGSKITDHLHPQDLAAIEAEMRLQGELGGHRPFEFRKRNKAGGYTWMSGRARILRDLQTGQTTGFVSVSRDATQERAAREELRKREERFRSLTSLSSDWYWETDADGRYTFVSDGIRRLFGIVPKTLLGEMQMVYGGDLEQPGLREYRACLEQRRPFRHLSFRARGSGDTDRTACISGEPVFEEGVFLGFRGVGRDVTEERALAEKLARLAEENKALIENSLDMMLLIDENRRILRANAAAREILGYAPEELEGRDYADLLHPEDDAMTRAVQERLQTGRNTIQDFEVRCIRKDGSVGRLSFSVRWSDESRLLYASARDIGERYRIQAELRKSKDELTTVLESIGDAFFALDRNWRATYVNQKTARFVGKPREELVGKVLWEAVPEIWNSPVLPHYRKAMETGQDVFFEAYYGPSAAWVEARIYAHDEGLSVFFHDISDRKKAETAIRESERRYRELIEMTPAGYFLANAEARLLAVNPALCDMLGHDEEALLGRSLTELFPVMPCEGALFIDGGPVALRGKELPMRHKDGGLIYVLANSIIRRDRHGKAQSMTSFVTDITQRMEAEVRLKLLATHDTLTDLPNRTLLNERVDHMLAAAGQDSAVAVMFIDLDQFKEVNDSLGHEPGDSLLREVARRLQQAMRPGDMVARLGGDEFVVAMNCADGAKSAGMVAERLLGVLTAPIEVAGREVFVTASIGISMYPQDGRSRDLLYQNADTAMYRAKAAGRNGYCFFKAEMSVEAKTRMLLEQALRRALERDEFELYYQPRLDLKTMAVTGMEALIRWNHPELGQVSPMQFIPIAEEKGLIEAIGRWVLQEACAQTRRLSDKYRRRLQVSVNLSARQLKSLHLPAQVSAAMTGAGLDPALLELELTETALIEDIEFSASVLRELKQLGIHLSVDDFGTGYSGLAYLRRFPLDTLKLDRSFVMRQGDEPDHVAFLKAFVDLAHALKLSVVAEGVETHDTLLVLRQIACDEAQGFLFARPLPLDEFERFLARLPVAGA